MVKDDAARKEAAAKVLKDFREDRELHVMKNIAKADWKENKEWCENKRKIERFKNNKTERIEEKAVIVD